MTKLLPAVVLLHSLAVPGAPLPSNAQSGPCCSISPEARAAVLGAIPEYLMHPGMALCGTGSYIPFELLQRNRSEALPCLMDMYWRGVTLPDPCKRGRHVDGTWALTYIRLLDERLAIGILETEASRAPRQRVARLAQLALLGDRRHLGELMDVMEGEAASSGPSGLTPGGESILEVLSAVDAREVLPRLRALRDGSAHESPLLVGVVAQLERDAPTLVALGAQRPEFSSRALGMLDMIAAREEALELLAHTARRPMTAVSAGNEIAERHRGQRGSLLLRARLVTPFTVSLGDPVEVEVTIQNVSQAEVTLPRSSFLGLRILAGYPRIHALSWRTPPRTPLLGSRRTLAPGERLAVRVRADHDYEFDQAGLFGVTAELNCRDESSWSGHLEAPWFEVDVRPAPEASTHGVTAVRMNPDAVTRGICATHR